MRVNVMGATGQLGRKVIAALLERGAAVEDVVGSARSPAKGRGLGVEIREADYDDRDSMRRAFSLCDVVLLIPSTAPVEPRIVQHASALGAARSAGVKHVLFSSLTTAQPGSLFHISPFLLYAECKTRQSGMEWTILRSNMYLDPIADWIPELIKMTRLPYPVREGRVAYVSRDDLAQALAAACLSRDHVGETYELTGPRALSMPELAGIVARITGQKVAFDSITEAEFAEVCRDGEEDVSESMIEILTSIYRAVDNGEFSRVTDHVERLTGRPPEAVEDYLRRVWSERKEG
jgi:NAD(P)H dehydrogenase (quinone)